MSLPLSVDNSHLISNHRIFLRRLIFMLNHLVGMVRGIIGMERMEAPADRRRRKLLPPIMKQAPLRHGPKEACLPLSRLTKQVSRNRRAHLSSLPIDPAALLEKEPTKSTSQKLAPVLSELTEKLTRRRLCFSKK
ncbi:MAG TPA: hypothetical protein VEL47_02045 [Myxococcota bacterium]|nr:hypothetical protein [Myxococcota bacterium]